MRILTITLIVNLFLWLLPADLRAQDLGSLGRQAPVGFHGSIGAGVDFYHSNELYPTRDPLAWNIYGNFSPSLYGIYLPFSFVITQYSKSYVSPFTQFGISPSYKWIRLHLGYRSLSFSPLVFDGQSFLGGGIELSPRGFYFGAFYGRLNKAVSEDTTYGHVLAPQYARTGYGVKLGVGGVRNNFSVQFFHARDDSGSIHRLADSLTTVLPQENSVFGFSWHFTFFKSLVFTGDAATSLLNRDESYQQIDSIGYYKIPRLMQKLMPVNYSSVVSYSGQAQLSLVLRNLSASAGYRRVQPDFKSLGVPYALDDVEMVNGSLGVNMDRGRMNVNASYNGQHNNLSHMLSSTLETRTGNFSMNNFISSHFTMNLNLTGVQVYQKDGLMKLNDSARMNQWMFTGTVSPTLNFSGGVVQHTISLSMSYTNLDDRNPVTAGQTQGNNFCSSLNYALFFVRSFWGLNGNIIYSQYGQEDSKYRSAGFNAGINAQLLSGHNLLLQGSAGYFLNHSTGGLSTGNNTSFSFNGSYGLKEHSLGVYLSYILTPPVNLNPLSGITQVPYAVNTKNLSGGVSYACHF